MKSFIKPAVLFTALTMLFAFASCETETNSDNPAEYTVTFDGNGAEPAFTDKVSVKSGEGLLIPKIKLTKTGYDFAGWYIGDVEATSETKIAENTTVTAHWTLHEYTINYKGLEGAENPNSVTTYTIESEEITLLDAEKNGCNFGGWKNGNDFVTKIPKGSTGDITLTAEWGPVPVDTITFNTQNPRINPGYTRTLTVTVLPENASDKTVTWTSSDTGVATVENGVVTAVAEGTVTITATAGGQSADCVVTVKNLETVTFGRWPQTIKNADVSITNETKTAGMFTYYKGSDGEWYVKAEENASKSNYTYSDGTTVGQDGTSEKYFKVEPVKWRVLTDNYNGKRLLLAESILVSKRYDDSSSNYAESEIRSWLNYDFLTTAFSADEIEQIATVTVDNSARSTNPDENAAQWKNGINKYTCDNTEDKVFLLSEQEVTAASYGFDVHDAWRGDKTHTESSRIHLTTDFAKASGAWLSTIAGNGGFWWLRSPDYGLRDRMRSVGGNGDADRNDEGGDPVYLGTGGVVPALCLK